MRARGTGSSFLRWRRENRREQASERGGDSPTGADGGIPGKGKGCYRKGKGTSDRPSAGQVSFSHGDWDGLYFPKMNATISATHMLFCKLILALSHPLEPRRALGGCDKSNVVEMAPGQFGFLPLA